MRFGLVCWRHLLGSILICILIVGGATEEAKANLSWTCTTWRADGWGSADGSSFIRWTSTSYNGDTLYVPYNPKILTAFCSSASITGSISATISDADKNAIVNGVTGSSVITNIKNKVNQAADNTVYTKNGNTWSAARWAAEGYTLSSSISTDTTAIKTQVNTISTKVNTISTDTTNIKAQIQDIKVAVESNPPFIHNIKGKNNATATSNGTFTVIVEAQNAVQYRGRYDNSAWTEWTTNKEVVITGIPPGLRTITIEAQNSKGETYSKEMTVFSL